MQKFCKERSLAFLNPELVKEWDYSKNDSLTPENVFAHSHKNIWWICKDCKQSYLSKLDRRSSGHGCPYCSGHKVGISNCLSTVNPKLSIEWNSNKNGELTPNDVTANSNKLVWWKCSICSNEWEATIIERNKANSCYRCKSLAVLNPELSKEWHPTKNIPLTPFEVTSCNDKKVWWLCSKCGREYRSTVSSRSTGTGCYRCHRIELKSGIICDSFPEAYFYLKLNSDGVNFRHRVLIGMGKHTCDFYIPSENKYIEVTGFGEKWLYWEKYCDSINKKRNYIKIRF